MGKSTVSSTRVIKVHSTQVGKELGSFYTVIACKLQDHSEMKEWMPGGLDFPPRIHGGFEN